MSKPDKRGGEVETLLQNFTPTQKNVRHGLQHTTKGNTTDSTKAQQEMITKALQHCPQNTRATPQTILLYYGGGME